MDRARACNGLPGKQKWPPVLPAWATVVLAIGGTLIGAAAGIYTAERSSSRAYRSAERNSRRAYLSADQALFHETQEAWRTLQIETCRALSDAWARVPVAPLSPSRNFGTFDKEAEDRLGTLGTTCAQTVAKARLVFGIDKTAGKAAEALDERSHSSKDAALATTPWDEAARERIRTCIRQAEDAHKAFLLEAHMAIQPQTSWQPKDFK